MSQLDTKVIGTSMNQINKQWSAQVTSGLPATSMKIHSGFVFPYIGIIQKLASQTQNTRPAQRRKTIKILAALDSECFWIRLWHKESSRYAAYIHEYKKNITDPHHSPMLNSHSTSPWHPPWQPSSAWFHRRRILFTLHCTASTVATEGCYNEIITALHAAGCMTKILF